MCGCGDASHESGQAAIGKISRRTAMVAGTAAIGAAALGTAACSPAQAPQAPQSPPASPTLPDNALITVGVAAGPPPTPNKFGISSTLKIGSDLYVIDCGLGR